MPAEAIHLSAWHDTITVAQPHVRRMAASAWNEAARAGALLVDLPYFDRFAMVFVRYALKWPQAPSRWGDVLHQRAPISLGVRIGEAGVRLGRSAATAEAGSFLRAMALGYVSHAALDTAIHPLVNRLAVERMGTHGGTQAQQHSEVEKFQSILFHQQRNGFDFMGTRVLRDHVSADFSSLVRTGPVGEAVREAMIRSLGEAPPRAELSRWIRGYRQYVWVISGPLGKRIAPEVDKERERAATFDAVDFPGRYEGALARSRAWVDALAAYLDDGACDEQARAALSSVIPEQTLDPGPEQA